MEDQYATLKLQIAEISKKQDEIQENQKKISDALLGSLDGSTGLLEDHRNMKEKLEATSTLVQEHETKISELCVFKRDVMKVVAAVAIAIPIVFELSKGLLMAFWDYIIRK